MRALLCLIGCAITIPTATASAQHPTDFSALPVKVGDTIFVTDAATGVAVSGPLTGLSPAQLSIGGYAFTPASALKIERAGDSIWNGAAVGFALGAFALYPVVPETFVSQGGRFRINNGLMWAAVGALIDAAHKGRKTIYRSRPTGQDLQSSTLPARPQAGSASFAPDFSHLPTKVGDRIYVTEDATGVEVSGSITTLTPGELALAGYTFTPGSTLRIERPGDPLWDGALIGWGVGALLGGTVGAEGCLHRAQWHCVAEGGLTYALLGVVIDFAHKGRRTIYKGPSSERSKAVHVVPAIGPDRKMIALAVGF